jgi:hypothetical protein
MMRWLQRNQFRDTGIDTDHQVLHFFVTHIIDIRMITFWHKALPYQNRYPGRLREQLVVIAENLAARFEQP